LLMGMCGGVGGSLYIFLFFGDIEETLFRSSL
jgi:hypothetical protein